MKPENRGLFPVFMAVLLLALVARALPTLSLTRSIVLGSAGFLFLGGILFFTIRGGWITERQSPRGLLFSSVAIAGFSSIFAALAYFRDKLSQWPVSGLLAGLLGTASLFVVLDRIGALIAAFRSKSLLRPKGQT